MNEYSTDALMIGRLLGGLIGCFLGSLISAVFLRAASKWVVKLEVPFGKAYWIVFSAFVINFIIGFIFGLLAESKGSIGPAEILFLLMPVGFLIQSLII